MKWEMVEEGTFLDEIWLPKSVSQKKRNKKQNSTKE